MTKYRKKPVEVEAWQMGSDEPMPNWARKRIMYLPRPTQESYAYWGMWIVLYKSGKVEFNSPGQFEQTYEVAE